MVECKEERRLRQLNAMVSDFQRGYTECAIWASTMPDSESGEPLEEHFTAGDLSYEARVTIAGDCRKFCEENRSDLENFGDLTMRDDAYSGHDLWLTRNGHGTGYWDRYMEASPDDRAEAEAIGRRLTDAARRLGETDLYPGDDGRLYLS